MGVGALRLALGHYSSMLSLLPASGAHSAPVSTTSSGRFDAAAMAAAVVMHTGPAALAAARRLDISI